MKKISFLLYMILVVFVSCNKSALVSENENKSAELVSDSSSNEIIDMDTILNSDFATIRAIEIIADMGDSAYYNERLPSGLSRKDFEVDFQTEALADLEWDLNIAGSKLFRGNSGSRRVNTSKAFLTEGAYISYKDAYNFTGKVLVDCKDNYPNAQFYYVDLYYSNLISPRLIARVTIKY
jgi:hypothetical protein